MKKNIFCFLVFLTVAFSSCIDEPVGEPNTYKGNFEALWKIIDTRYCYLDYKRINWDSIHTVYKQKVDTVSSQYSFFDLMAAMLNELKDGHVNLYSDFDQSRYWKWFMDYPSNFDSKLIFSHRYLSDDYRIAGGMRYKKINGGRIGYIYYGDFSSVFTDTHILSIMKSFSDCKALIIDVRDNGGGYMNLAEQLASYFFDAETITGYMTHKTGTGHADFSPPEVVKTPAHKTIQWKRPVIVLTNRMSYSSTNNFVCRMKQAPNAIVVGDKTGGGGGLPLSSEIPNGWMVRFSACPMYDANMNQTEWGIDPDVKVDLSASDVANGYDSVIERAIKIISQ